MKKLYGEMAELLEKKESFVVATLFDKAGSAPRTNGTKMVIRKDGSIGGTIGGGRLEADAINLALSVIASGQSKIASFKLTGEDVAAMDMICGGQGDILLDYIDAAEDDNRKIYQQVAELFAKREKGWLVTSLGEGDDKQVNNRQQCLVKHDGTRVGRFEGDPKFLTKLIPGPAKISIHAKGRDNQQFVVEPIRPPAVAYIFGAGHVSQKIAPLCESVGFTTKVLDDRPEYANRDRFPEAVEIILLESFERLPQIEMDENGYVVIVTRGHLYDKPVLAWSLRTRAGYIGMIGSRRKRDKIFAALVGEGFARAEFERVYSPIGTDIGAETPEELAVSIVGELIKVRMERENARRA